MDEEKEGINDPVFLMEVLQAREAVDDTEESEELQGLKSEYLSTQKAIIKVLA